MTKEEFREYYKKNKVVVMGVPVIILMILVQQFILKPSKPKKVEGTPAATDAAAGQPDPSLARAVPPPPLANIVSSIPKLDPRIESRLIANEAYPYGESKNVFLPPPPKLMEKPTVAEVFEPQVEPQETVIERPDISYHGFFRIGNDKVAILKLSQRLLLTREGQKLLESPFVLQSVLPDRVVIKDLESKNVEFEVVLIDDKSPNQNAGQAAIPAGFPGN